MLFLIHYDRLQTKIVSFTEYKDSERAHANQARLELEIQYNQHNGTQEIVLLEAVNKAQLKKTHPKYVPENSLIDNLFIGALIGAVIAGVLS
jgi:hypothetical protein